MNKHLEHFLLSVLTGMSVLLGLTFWLNVKYGFNLLSGAHWHKLALLQASNTPIDKSFYVSIAVAILIFIFGLNVIYRPKFRKISLKRPQNVENKTLPAIIESETKTTPAPTEPEKDTPVDTKQVAMEPANQIQTNKMQEPEKPMPQNPTLTRPPKLNIPSNMAQIAATQHNLQNLVDDQPTTQYDDKLAELFSNTAYLVKKNHTIAGLTTNLLAIGNHEIIWVGCVDCNLDKMKNLIKKLQETFTQTLPDIPINVYSFLLDTKKRYDKDPDVFIFHDLEELTKFILENQGTDIDPEYQEDFDAYSEYIDTVLSLMSNH